MKKVVEILSTAFVVTLMLTMVPAISTEAKTNEVKYELKNGTLTISGKGVVNKAYRGNKKIKKVVIKKGITMISAYAFSNCKNLKSVSIPNTVKTIGVESFYKTGLIKVKVPKSTKTIGQYAFTTDSLTSITLPGDYKVKSVRGDEHSYTIASGEKLQNVNFTTNFKYRNASSVSSYNLNVSSKDPNFKSVDGVIYTKNGSGIVRVPAKRSSIKVVDGTKTFYTQSVTYGFSFDGDDYLLSSCKSIDLPASVTKVDVDGYYFLDSGYCEPGYMTVTLHNNLLNDLSIQNLFLGLGLESYDVLMKQLPNLITQNDDAYMAKGGTLLKYTGTDKTFYTIPDGTKVIGKAAFMYDQKLETVNIPNSVVEVMDEAFANSVISKADLPESVTKIGMGIYCNTQISKVQLPSKITSIPEYTYFNCLVLKDVVIPNQVTSIGNRAFGFIPLKSISFGKNLKSIGEEAFSNSIIDEMDTLTIPITVEKIDDYAFLGCNIKNINIQGDTKNISELAFSACTNSKYIFATGPKTYFTNLSFTQYNKIDKNTMKITLEWNKVSNVSGYQIQYSLDKKFKKNVRNFNAKGNKTSLKFNVKDINVNYYSRIRTFKKVDGKKIYGKWVSIKY